MPIPLLPSRRSFLAATSASGLIATFQLTAAEANRDVNRIALLADTHIPSQANVTARGTNMTDNLKGVVQQLLAREKPFGSAFILGDCAYLDGKAEDYVLLKKLLEPLQEKDWLLHLALGNHDHREHCLQAFSATHAELHKELSRRVAMVQTPRANWFLLDSLDKVNSTPGQLGESQLQWLATALDAHADRPALIGIHHNMMSDLLPQVKVTGLLDTKDFFNVIDSRRHVKAVFFGHTHAWSVIEHAGIHLVNLPPVAYVFTNGQPAGWIECDVLENAAKLTMHCHDTKHKLHRHALELKWRT
jgi:3',5'-cyclic-AMP phosphodiesterase